MMILSFRTGVLLLAAYGVLSGMAAAQTQQALISAEAKSAFAAIAVHPLVKKGLAFLEADDAATLIEQKQITVVPAPPFKEQKRSEYYRARLAELGLEDLRVDAEGNAIGVRRGSGNGPKLVVSAHLDTVFPEGTDVTIKEKDGRLYAPGISDDSRGLAEMLSIIRALNATGIKTVGDIWFVGIVGEEELGDLRGVKALFRDTRDIDGFISIESPSGGVQSIGRVMVGSRRFRVTFKGPGGHSFGAFGLPSAIHALGRAVAKISEVQTPKSPKTTFTVGTITGGISTNSIASEAAMQIDMRSSDRDVLGKLEAEILSHIKQAVAEENTRWGATSLNVDITLIGDRPAGSVPFDSPVIQAAALEIKEAGFPGITFTDVSTDANLPVSLGIPAVRLASGGRNGGVHTFEEWYEPKLAYIGPQTSFLTVLGLVGIEGVSPPILPKRAPRQ